MKNLIKSSFLAGLFISIGCIVNLSVGGGIPGAVLFTLGLASVVSYKLKLYTGTAGFISRNELPSLSIILGGNILACALVALLSPVFSPGLSSSTIVLKVLSLGYLPCFINAIFCGILMTLAVKFAREKNWIPLLFAVPVFILSGFRHSIADFTYFTMYGWNLELFGIWICEVVGNFIGCNLKRLFLSDDSK